MWKSPFTALLLLLLGSAVSGEINASDRIYTGDQSSNTVTVIKPLTGEVLGTIGLGSGRLSDVIGPQYLRAVNSHGLGFSRDGRFLVSLSVTTNTVTVIRCEDNSIQSQTSSDRAPHEALFASDNRTVWVATRGTDFIDLIDGVDGGIIGRVESPGGPSKVLFSPDGKLAYANHIRSPTISVIDVASRKILYSISGLADRFSSDMMLSADGLRLWAAHKMIGKVSVISTEEKKVVAVLDTGVETNHPHFATVDGAVHGFITVAALDLTRVYRQADPLLAPVFVRDIPSSGIQPHGLSPSPDGSHLYVVNEHSDTVDFISLKSWRVEKTVTVAQEGQALVYVANAVPNGNGTQNLGKQGLYDQPASNKLVHVQPSGGLGHVHKGATATGHKAPTALITVRRQTGLDMFQVIGRDLRVNSTYTASAVATCKTCGHARIPLVDFTAKADPGNSGCGIAPQVLAFFKFFGVYDLDTLQITEVED